MSIGKIFTGNKVYKTYVMHYTPLQDRRQFITEQLLAAGIKDFEFISEFDREELTEEDLARYDKDHDLHREVSEVSRRGHGYAGKLDHNYEEMTLSSISLNMKHLSAFNRFMKQNEEFGLFLEDDCRFINHPARIEDIIDNAPSDWDVIFLGGAFDHGILTPLTFKDGYMLAAHPATNTTSSILYKKKSVSKILPHMESFCLSIDWQLNYAFHEAKLNVYHTYPYLCTQGDFRSTAKDE